MSPSTVKTLLNLQAGDQIIIHTALGGSYPRNEVSKNERDNGSRVIVDPGPSQVFSGTFLRVLEKDSDKTFGPFVDNYLQVQSIGEAPVYSTTGFKIVGWVPAEKVLSIPFRNINMIEVSNK